jgi:hypothetical protein
MPENTPLGYPFPENTDLVDVAGDIQGLAEAIDVAPGVEPLTQAQITGLPAGELRDGRVVYNITQSRLEFFSGSAWVPVETQAGAQTRANAAKADAALDATSKANTVAAQATAVASDLGSHKAATTSVHGISDTSALATKTYADQAASAAAAAVVDAAPQALNTLKELATALGNDASFATTVTNSLASKAASSDLTSHTSATTNVHGIGDTSSLETTSGAQAKANTARGAAEATAATALASHAAATSLVHGLPDTSTLVVTTDSRLSNARTPVAHKSTHVFGGTDALSPGDIGAALASHTHVGFTPAADAQAAGDLIVGVELGVWGRLGVGTNGQLLSANAAGTGVQKLRWIDPPAVGPSVQVGGSEPVSALGYLWVDTRVEV